MGIRVGIDLGTTFSAVARINQATGKPEIIKNIYGNPTTPSVLCFQPDGDILHGDDAKNMQGMGDTNTASFFKRSMGKLAVSFDILGKSYSPTDLSAILLKKLVQEAEAQSGESVDAAVITVPAYFTHIERAATKAAGAAAGIDVIAIINEPSAAAFAYGLNEKEGEQTVMIYDLGGGTFDVTIAQINKNNIQVLGCDGNHELGGKDWDDCIARYLAAQLYEEHGIEITDLAMVNTLLVAAEAAKKQLTARDRVTVPIHFKDIKTSVEISNEIFEEISHFLLGTTKDVTENLLASLGIGWHDLDGVILVGGSTRMRMIHKYVESMSGKPPLKGVNVDEAVALGAAIRANITSQGESIPSEQIGGFAVNQITIQGARAIIDATAHSLGLIAISEDGSCYTNSKIILRNSSIPAKATKPYGIRMKDKDTALEVYVLQGEHDRPLDNTIVHKYVVTGMKGPKHSEVVIEVTYGYTEDGIIEVSAMQQGTSKALDVDVQPIPDDMAWTDQPPSAGAKAGDISDLKIAVTSKSYDDIGAILRSMKLPYSNFRSIGYECDVLFINCGTSDRIDIKKLHDFVQNGGCVYISDFAADHLIGAFPGSMTYTKNGKSGRYKGTVMDPDLQSIVGKDINIYYDTIWVLVKKHKGDCMVVGKGGQYGGVPMMFSFQYGEGSVFFTSFHNHVQASEKEQMVLQAILLKQLGSFYDVGIHQIGKILGIDVDRIQNTLKS